MNGSEGGSRQPPRATVLVVEDDTAIAELVRLYLERDGYLVRILTSGQDALDAAFQLHPVAIVLDIGLPEMDGLEVCRRLRAAAVSTPVLFLTARDEEVDRVLGLELGGDDYITKPFSPRELVARLKAVLRRSDPGFARNQLAVGRVRLDPDRRQVWADDRPVELTATEFDLLAYLMRRPGRVYPREMLLSEVWDYPGAVSRTVDVHIAQLRAKLGAESPIRTVRGVGYAADDS